MFYSFRKLGLFILFSSLNTLAISSDKSVINKSGQPYLQPPTADGTPAPLNAAALAPTNTTKYLNPQSPIYISSQLSAMVFDKVQSQGETSQLSTTGGSCKTPVITYTTSTPSICSINGSQVKALNAGSCKVTATEAACPSYKSVDSATLNIPVTNVVAVVVNTQNVTASAAQGCQNQKINLPVTITGGVRPYRVFCQPQDYKTNCSVTVGTTTVTDTQGSHPSVISQTGTDLTVQVWIAAGGGTNNGPFAINAYASDPPYNTTIAATRASISCN